MGNIMEQMIHPLRVLLNEAANCYHYIASVIDE
jgi:hypothetical protein